MAAWLPTASFAELAGVDQRTARRIIEKAEAGRLWQGCALIVRPRRGRGGRSGIGYEVRVDSLPDAIRERLSAAATAGEGARGGGQRRVQKRRAGGTLIWIGDLIRPALDHPKGSTARGDAIRRIAAGKHVGPDGKPDVVVGENQVRKWISDYEAEGRGGLAALGRKRRADRGRPRIKVSRAFDRAAREAGVSEDTLDAIAADLRAWIGGYARANGSRQQIRNRLPGKLAEIAREHGFQEPVKEALTADLRTFEKVITAGRNLHIKETNAAAHRDRSPHIRRSIDGLFPGDVVEVDGWYQNHLLNTEDGSGTARAVIFKDRATGVLFGVVFPPGVTFSQATIGLAFKMAFTSEHFVGLPKQLVMDNGGEFKQAEVVAAILEFAEATHRLDRTVDLTFGKVGIVRTRPYEPRGKSVENSIGVLERTFLCVIPGDLGSDRMTKKPTKALGEKSTAHPGTFDDYCQHLDLQIQQSNHSPKQGQLKGASPYQRLQDFIAKGWGLYEVSDQLFFEFCFADIRVVAVRKGAIECHVRNQSWRFYDDAFLGLERVTVRICLWDPEATWAEIRPNEWRALQSDDPFAVNDADGARESRRRRVAHDRYTAREGKALAVVKPQDEARQFVEDRGGVPKVPAVGRIYPTDEAEQALKSRERLPPPGRRGRHAAAADNHGDEQAEAQARLLEKMRGSG